MTGQQFPEWRFGHGRQGISSAIKWVHSLLHVYCINKVDLDATSLLISGVRYEIYVINLLSSAVRCVLSAAP